MANPPKWATGVIREVYDVNTPKKAPPLDARLCHDCGKVFTAAGLKMHKGSYKCELATMAKPMKEEVDATISEMVDKGKVPIVKNVALAIIRRGVEEVCGLEVAPTKLVHTDIDCYIEDQYWVESWIHKIWQNYNKQGYTRAAYNLFKELSELPLEARESKIGLILLGIYG